MITPYQFRVQLETVGFGVTDPLMDEVFIYDPKNRFMWLMSRKPNAAETELWGVKEGDVAIRTPYDLDQSNDTFATFKISDNDLTEPMLFFLNQVNPPAVDDNPANDPMPE